MNPPQENPSDNSLGDNSLINKPQNQTSQDDSITQFPDNANEPESRPVLGSTADISTESFTVPVRMNENSAQASVSTNDFQVQPTVTAPVSTSGPYGSDVTEPTVTDQVTRPYSPTDVQSNQPVAPTMTNSPAVVVSGAVGSVQPNPSTNTSVPVSGKSGRRIIPKAALIIGAVLVLLGMTAGYVFGYYIPNKPENVWKTGMNRTGKAISLLTDTALEKGRVKKVETGVMEMSITGKTKEVSFSGNLDAKMNDAKLVLKTTVDYSATAGEAEKHELDIDLLASLPENAIFPTVYAKLSGLTAADTQGLAPTVAQYLDKWIYADEKMIKETYPEYAASLEETRKYAKDSVKVEDVSKFIKGLTVTTNEYVFTSDPEKAVLEMREVVGKEKLGDINTIHYKASLNKANAIKYCEAAAASAYGSDLFKKLASQDNQSVKKPADSKITKDCQDSIEREVKLRGTYDLWIETKYKLIHKVRIYEGKKDTKNYIEIGQRYSGGDEIKFFSNAVREQEGIGTNATEKSTTKIQLSTNVKSYKTALSVDFSDNKGSAVKVDASLSQTDDKVTFDVPQGAVQFTEVMRQLYGGQ